MNRSCPLKAVAWAAAALCALFAASAQAQSATANATASTSADTPSQTLPDVSITGTALRRIDAETALPITVLRRADIERAGVRNTTELLQQLPAMQGLVQTTAVVGQDTRGYASVSIHDLGDAYTLVLLNGQRVAPFGGQLSSGQLSGVDVNTIPLAMIERIEVLTDGASALYGADALGGVVNIITRRDGDDNEATISLSLPKGGGREWQASAIKSIGSVAETGQNLTLGAAILHRSALQATARSYARESMIEVEQGGQRYRYVNPDHDGQYNTAPANGYDFNGHTGNLYRQANSACPTGQYSYYYGTCLYNFAPDLDLLPQLDQHSLMASYTRQIGPDGKLALDALWSRSEVLSHLAPAATTFVIPATSPLYGALQSGLGVDGDPAYADYRFVDLGRRRFTDTSTLLDLAARLDGRTAGWAWQGALKWSVSDLRSRIGNAMGTNAAQSLVDGGNFDPFAMPGAQSPAGLAALRAQAYDGDWLRGQSTLRELQWQAARELSALPGGPLQWALGANVRHEQLRFKPSLFAQGLLADPAAGTLATEGMGDLRLGDFVPLQPMSASRLVWGAFTELNAPVSPALDLGAAVRMDHDEFAGQALTGKASARWRPTPNTLWRASLGTGFKAPTLSQLRSPTQSNSSTVAAYDCTAALQAQATALGAVPCATDSAASNYPQVGRGNAELQPEHSVQASLGFRIDPLPGHSVGIDLWAVHIHDRIGSVDESVAFATPAAFPGAWTTVPGSGGTQLAYSSNPLNLGTLMSSGIDIDASVRRGSRLGLFDSQLRVSAILREDAQSYPGGPWVSNIGDGQSGAATLKWRASWRTSLIHAGWTHSLTARYQSGYTDSPASVEQLDANGNPTGVFDNIRLKAPGQLLWDWQTSWQITGSVQLTAGIVNLFNTRPPLSLNETGPYKAQMLGYDERYYDARGRVLTLQAKASF